MNISVQKYFLLSLLLASMLLPTLLSSPVTAQGTQGICDRSPAVITLLLTATGASNCAEVTQSQLTAITGVLSWNSTALTNLATNDLDNLTGVTDFVLSDNGFTQLINETWADVQPASISLANNQLSSIEATAFLSGVAGNNDVNVNLTNNTITAVTLSSGFLNGNATEKFVGGEFDLSFNQIDSIVATSFASFNPSILHLNDNDIASIADSSFSDAAATSQLYLRNNAIVNIAATTLAGLTKLSKLDLANNSIATIAVGAFESINVTDINLTDNDLVSLPPNLLANHADPSSITNFEITGNPVAASGWAITNVSWVEDIDNPGDFSLQIGHALPEDITVDLTSGNGNLNASSIVIAKGNTVSNTVSWTATSSDTDAHILPTTKRINVTILGGHINIPELGIDGICGRTQKIQELLLEAIPDVNDCNAVTATHLASITGTIVWSRKEITSITAGDFASLTNLQRLFLNNNQLTTIPSDAFASLTNLQSLRLENNQLTTIASDTFASLTNLDDLRLDNNQLTTIHSDAFASLTNLQSLQLENNQLTTIPSDTFASLTNLNDLLLDNNQLTTIASDTFASLTNLSFLGLDNNQLTTIASDTFASLTNLEDLGLDNNQLTTIPSDTFASLTNLQRLRLGNNQLTTIPSDTFASLTNLSFLGLDNNQLTTIASDTFASLTNLFDLYLNNNQLTTIPSDAFAGLTNLLVLRLSNNQLPTIASDAFASLTNLEYLWLNNNNLTTIPSDAFASLTNLKLLFLYNNQLTTIHSDAFASLTNLEDLLLDNNQLTTIHSDAFASLTNLDDLWLNNNNLTTIPSDAFTNLTATNIRLHNNQIASLPLNLLENHTQPSSITNFEITGNPVAASGWAITNVSWVEDIDNPGDFSLQIGHALPEDITVDLTSGHGNLNASSIVIAKGNTVSNTVSWTATSSDTDAHILPTTKRINVTILGGHINIPELGIDGICGRTQKIQELLLEAIPDVNDCNAVTATHLASITGRLNWIRKEITSIAAGDFASLTNLQRLDLGFNQLTTIHSDAFASLTNLQRLQLDNNQLTTIPSDAFASLTNLRTLFLNNNQLTTIPSDAFANLTKLAYLYLSNNQLTTIPSDAFASLTNLQVLWLNSNDIASITDNTFASLTNLEELAFQSNQLTTIPSDTFASLTNLRFLELQNNNLTTIASDAFASLTNLKSLRLDDNQLTTIHSDAFASLTNLEDLYLSNNQLTTIPSDAFASLTNLQILGLDNNQLTTIPSDAFTNLTVTDIRLHNNQIASLPLNLLENHTQPSNITAFFVSSNALVDNTWAITNVSWVEDIDNPGNFSLQIGHALPEDITVDLTSGNGNLNASSIVIAKGQTVSNTVSWTATSPDTDAHILPTTKRINVTILGGHINIPELGIDGICGRTQKIQELLLEAIPDINDCNAVTATHLASITNVLLWNNQGITSIAAGDFNGLSNVYALELDYNQISSIPADAFASLTNLLALRLDDNQLTTIHSDAFASLTNLINLYLSNNQLTTIHSDAFANLTNLQGLRLDNNQLTTIHSDAFASLTNLQNLRLSNNQLTTIHSDAFANLTNLIQMSLSGNQLTTIHSDAFASLTNLKFLLLDNNNLTTSASDIFAPLTNLEELFLHNNPLTTIASDTFASLTNLIQLYLHNNQLTTIPSDAFASLTNLKILWLDNNQLTTIPSDAFANLTNLEELDLGQNNLTTIHSDAFADLTNLEELDLGQNNLTTIPSDAFANLTATVISLHNNQIASLPLNLLENHTQPSNITGFFVSSNALVNNTWAITNVSWVEDTDNPGDFSLQIGHALPEDITVDLTSGNGNLNASSIVIAKGNTVSDTVSWTATSSDTDAHILPTTKRINVTPLSGHINIPELGIYGICGRTQPIPQLLLDAIPDVNDCNVVTATHLASISELFWYREEITSIAAGDFNGLSNVFSLRLDNNPLTTIPSDAFASLTNLQSLRLDNNQLTTVPSDAFASLTNLQSLRLHHNQLTTIPSDAFASLTNLQSLRLDNNQLTTIADNAFASLTNLLTLRLHNSQLTTIASDAFASLTNLEELDLSNNQLTTIPSDAFASLTNLEVLDLPGNQLTTIPSDAFASLTNLENLVLTNNQLTTILSDAFASLTNLETLWLYNNQLTTIPSDAFASLTNLRTLDLNNNQLTTIPADAFASLTKLIVLKLYENQLTTIPSDAFANLTATQISLHTNQITDLPLNLLANHTDPSSITNFELSDNPLTGNSWEITNVNWVEDIDNPGNFSLQIGHALPEDISIDITSSNGDLSVTMLNITKGETVSNTVTWTNSSVGAQAYIAPVIEQINVTSLGGHIIIPTLNNAAGICARSEPVTALLLTALNTATCEAVSISHLPNLTGDLDWSNQALQTLSALFVNDLDNLTGIDSFILANNSLTRLVNGTLNQTTPDAVNFASNSIATIGKLALFTTNQGNDDINVNLSSNAITTATLASGFLASNGNQQFVGGEFDLSFNQINAVVASSFTGFNPSILHLNDNEIVSIPASIFSSATQMTKLYLQSNNITAIGDSAFSGLSALTTLSLANNNITALSTNALTGLTASSLDLSNNAIVNITATTLAGLTNLNQLDLASNSIATIAVGAFESINVTDIDLTGNSITELPLNLLENHADPSSITNFELSGNPLTGNSWAITNVSWVEDSTVTNRFTLEIGHALPEDISIDITSSNGDLSVTMLNITKGQTVSNTVTWTNSSVGAEVYIIPTATQINITALSGHINIPSLNNADGVCDRSQPVTDFLLTALNTATCEALSIAQLLNLAGVADLSNQNIIDADIRDFDLDNLTGIDSFILANNSLTLLVNGTLNQTMPESVDFANNSIATIGKLALFTTNQGSDDINVNLSNNAITTTTLGSGFLTSNGVQQLVGGEFDLSFNQIDSIVAASFAGFNPSILHLNDNDIASIPASIFSSATQMTELYLQSNNITAIGDSAFSGLSALTTLSLANNNITALSTNALTGLTASSLDLSNNAIVNITATTLAGLTKLTKLDLASNSIATIAVGAFENINVTDIDLTDNSITDLPLNLLENHADPSSITNFELSGNPLASSSWAITNVSWVEDSINPGNFTLEIGHALTENLTITITSSNGNLNVASINITKGETVSDTVTWSAGTVGAQAYIAPAIEQINITALSGHIIIPTLNNAGGVCDRSDPVTALLLTSVNTDTCEALSISQLTNLTGDLDWSNQALQTLSALFVNDLDNLTGIASFILANNSLTSLVNGTLNQTTPESVDFANNSIATIGKLALFTTNQGSDDINVNLSSNAITTATLASDFLTANGNQQFVGGEFDLSFNQIDSIVATSFAGFNPSILHLNDNDIASIADNAFASAAGTTELYLSNNQLSNIAATTLAGLTKLNKLDLANNSIATIAVGAFENINVTDIDLTNNSITDLPLNLLENHADPSSITNFELSGNPLASSSWAITNVSWVEDSINPGNFTLEIGHALTENLTITITSSNGNLNVASINITKGETVSNTVTWTNSSVGAEVYIIPTATQINITALSGHIIIPTLNNAGGICDRSDPVTALLLTAVNTGTCEALSISQLTNLTGDLDWSNQALQTLSALFVNDLDNLTGIANFILANNSLTSLFNGTLNQTTPESVDFANNSIATIDKLALFTTNQGSDDINVNLSNNAITTATLASDFLTANGNQQFVGGEFDLSFNQIDSIVATSFAGFNPSILHLNDNDIASIADNALASAAGTTELYLSNNAIVNIAATTLAGLTKLSKLDLANNSIATIAVGAFENINVTDIDLTNNSITDLPLNLLENHADPSSITNFELSGNPLASSSWAITNVSWVEDSINPGNFTLEIGHALPEDITINLTSTTGSLNVTSINITKGDTVSNTVTWTAGTIGAQAYIAPTIEQINVTALSGHINIPTLNNAGGVCNRSQPVTDFLLTALNTATCEALSIAQLINLAGVADLSNQNIIDADIRDFDLDNLTGINSFVLANNSLTRLVNGTLNQTMPESVDFANNSIATIGKLALFTTNQGNDDINVNLSSNNITAATLVSGFLTANGNQQFVGGEFDLSFNQIDAIIAASFAGFNPSILHLNDNEIVSIPASIFSSATQMTKLYLQSNNITAIGDSAFSGLSALATLSLANNNITALSTNALTGLTASSLDLSNNAIVNITATTLAGLTNLNQLDLANNSIATIAVGAFENINVTDIDLTDNSITDLPLNLLANHADPSSISNFDIAGNPLASSSWAITNVRWIMDASNTNQYTLQLDHSLPEDITINITSSNGNLSVASINITKGDTVSDAVVWTATAGSIGADVFIVPTLEQITVTSLSGHINIPTLATGGICDRSPAVIVLLLTATGASNCAEVTQSQLAALSASLNWNNQSLNALLSYDLDNLTGIDSFILSNNGLTSLVDGMMNQTTPDAVNFASNSIATIGKLALFTTNQGNDDINVNLSNNAITTTTLGSGFLNANGNQQFVGGEFDLSFNQIDAIIATSFTGFNPNILHLNDNEIASIPASIFSSATQMTELYLQSNNITAIGDSAFSGLSALTTLSLANNNITALSTNALTGLTASSLDLSNNAIVNITATTLAGLTNLAKIDLANNSIATIAAGAFESINVTDIDLTDNSITDLPLNFLANHADPSSISNFDIAGNPLASSSWAITNVNWIMDASNTNQYTLQLDHSLPEDITINITSSNGNLSVASINITKGDTVSDAVVWTATAGSIGADVFIVPTLEQITVTSLSGHINIPTLATGGICDRSPAVIVLLLTATGASNCAEVTQSQLAALSASLNWNNQSLNALLSYDLDNLTGIDSFILSNNGLTSLVDGMMNQTTPGAVNFASNNIATIGQLALFTTNQGSDDINVNLSSNAITTTTLGSGFLNANGNQQFVGGEFDLSFNQIDAIIATSFTGFNPNILHLNDNEIVSIPASIFSSATQMTELYLQSNNITAIGDSAFSGLSALTTLSLANNNITALSTNALTGLTASSLDLSNNAIVNITATTLAGLTNLNQLDLANNSIATIAVGAFENINVTDINLTDNSITDLPLNLLANHADPSSISNFDIAGNPLASSSWAITNVNWIMDASNTNQYTLQLDHSLPEDITINITSSNGNLNVASINITKGDTVSDAVVWTATAGSIGADVFIVPTLEQITVTSLSGHINIPTLADGGICDRSPAVITLLLEATAVDNCAAVTQSQLTALSASLNWNNQSLNALLSYDLDNLTGIDSFILSNNGLTSLVDGMMNQTTPDAVNFASNSIATIGKLALFTTNQGSDDINVNLSSNAITTATLASGFLTASGQQKFVGGEFDLSFNQIDSIVATSFAGFNPSILHLNDNDIASIADSSFSDAAATSQLYLRNNAIVNIAAMTLAGLTNLTKIDLANNSIATIAVGAFENINVTDIDLTDNSITDLPLNLLANHADPSSISNFDIAGNPLASSSWAITNVNWIEDNGNFSLQLGHALTEDITINITSTTGSLNVTSINITKGDTVSDTVTWTAGTVGAQAYIAPAIEQINITALSGHIIIPTLNNAGGVCDRSQPVTDFLLTALNTATCEALSISQLINLAGVADLSNQNIIDADIRDFDLDNLTGIDSFILANNSLTRLVNGTLNQTTPESVDFSNNSIATIGTLALFTTNQGSDDINVNLSNNAITAATLVSGFLTASGQQKFVGGEFDLSFNQIDSIVATSFAGFNPSILHLNDNDIASIADSSFSDAAATSQLYLRNNAIVNIAATTLAGLTNLTKIDLANNSIATIAVGAFENINVTDIDLTDNSITDLPLNLLANHADPSSISNFDIAGNPLASSSWAITNVNWIEDNGNFSLQLGHALTEDITINITSTTGSLNVTSINITKGDTVSDTVTWTAGTVGAQAYIAPVIEQINVTALSGHINIPTLNNAGGVCDRSQPVTDFLLTALNTAACEALSIAQLINLAGVADLRNQNIIDADIRDFDLDNLTGIDSFILANNSLTRLVNGTLNQTTPESVDFANNSIATIGKLALFTTNQGSDDINVNLSSNSITTATLASGFLTASGQQKFVGGEFDLSFNQIDSIVATSFDGFNPNILRLNDNDIASIPASIFSSATQMTELYLQSNNITAIGDSAFSGLSALATLSLANNNITALSTNAFTGLTASSLDLSNNAIVNITATTLAGLTKLSKLDLANNSIATIAVGAFENINVTDIDLTDNSITDLPLNLLANHADPSSISNFDIAGNPLASTSWAITNVNWIMDASNTNQYTLQLDHSLPEDITINITSSNGNLSVASINITKGDTVSDAVVWTATAGSIGADVFIVPTLEQITVTSLSGHINIPTLADGGICDRSPAVITLLLEATAVDNCAAVTQSQLTAIAGALNWNNQSLNALLSYDLDNLTGIDSFILSNNGLTSLVDGMMNQTTPDAVNFASNSIATIGKLALFTTNQGSDDINVNLSSNNITAATLASGFLTASGQQKFVGGEFDLSFNQIDSIVATSFDGFNPNILRLNDNEIVSIPASIFSSATQMTELYLQSNNITAIGDSAFSGLSALTTLSLANNNITALSTNALTGLTASSLDLSNNAIVNITATTLAGLTKLSKLDLANNSIANIAVGAFANINVTDIDLTDNSITELPLNLLANHADPSSISNFDIAGNPLASSSWAITNVSWVEDSNNPDNFTLEIGHALPEDITINIASITGSLSATSIDITKGNTVSDTVTWTNSSIGSAVQIMPTAVQINVTILGGHINIPQLNAVPSFTPLASRSVVAEHLFDAIVLPAANGGSGTLTYSLFETNSTTASLPGSLTFTNATRTLNGSIDTAGNYNLTYSVIDANGASANATFILVVEPNLRPVFADNSNLSYTVVPNEELVNITLPPANTSNKVITYSLINISEDDLPADLVFNAIDRTIKGNTTATGIYAFMFVATDSLDGDTASINLTIDIRSNLPPVFNATEIDSIRIQTVRQDAVGGINITLPSVQNGNDPFKYSFQTNGIAGLPSGLQFRGTTSGAIQGKPTEFGDFNISVTVTDADLYSDSFSFTLTIIESLGFATDLPANYTVTPGVAFTSGELPAGKGGVPTDAGNYTYKLSDDLPTGLSFNSTSRMISGTTSVMGSYPVTYIVTDNEGIEYAEDTVLVVQLLTPEFMTQVDDMTMLIGQNINMTLPEVNTHNMTTIAYSISEQQGLKFNPATRQLNGSIARLGTHTITYRAVDTAGQEAEQVFDITVKANDAIIEDIMWRQALSIADQTVNSVKKRFDLVDQNRLPYVLAENFQGANFQVSKSNWLGLWTNIGTANLENRENNFNWNGSVETTQIGIDFSGEHFLAGVALETVSTSSAFTAQAEAFDYTGNFNIDDLELQSVYGGYYQDKFNIWAIASSGSGSASLDITAQNQTSLLSSGVDYAMTAFGGAFNINRVLNIGFEGIASASLDFADNTISNITSTSASRSKVFGSIEFGKWTQQAQTRDCLTWQPSLEFAFRNDSSDTASGTNSASGLELTAAVEIDYKLINLEIGVRSFSSDNYTETAQWFTFHIVPKTATGLNVELSQRLGDTGSVANSIFNNAELNDIVDGMSQSTELSSIGKISYGWAKDTGTYRLFTQGKSQINHAQTDALFGDVSAMFDSETGLVWDSIGIAFDSSDRKYTWSTDIQGGMINKYFNNIKDNTEATTVNFSAEIKF